MPLEFNLNKQQVSRNETSFDVIRYPDLLKQEDFEKIKTDVESQIKVKKKDNDLYRFKQSKDLKSEVTTKKLTPTISSFIDGMLKHVRISLEKTTGLELSTKHFDITVSRYDKGDYLLCHNDDIKNSIKKHKRALAFIFYLNSRPWNAEDGGGLILYTSDATGEPVSVDQILEPRPNNLIVFKTSETSWHSVQEVYCNDDKRLSINGWFHVDNPVKIEDKIMQTEPSPYKFLRPIPLDLRIEKFFQECINSDYLMEKTCFLIRRKFKKKSEINLTKFLVPEKYNEICLALKEAANSNENLKQIGPYNKRNYKVLKLDKLPQICRDLYDAFQSELFFMLLSRLTGLDLQPTSLCSSDSEKKEDEEDDDDDEEEDSDNDDDDESDGEDDVDNLEDEESSEDDTKVDVSDLKKQANSVPAADGNIIEKLNEASSSQPKPKKRKKSSDPIARMEFRHLEAGSYTLIHDHAYELGEKSALDVILHFNHDFAVNFDDGGFISYLDGTDDDNLHDMDCELLTIEPKSNCLSLAYRCDEGTCRFLKYLTKTHKANYQDLYCVFYEKPDDLPRAGDVAI